MVPQMTKINVVCDYNEKKKKENALNIHILSIIYRVSLAL